MIPIKDNQTFFQLTVLYLKPDFLLIRYPQHILKVCQNCLTVDQFEYLLIFILVMQIIRSFSYFFLWGWFGFFV